jgi:hypothetical protein
VLDLLGHCDEIVEKPLFFRNQSERHGHPPAES